MRTIVTKEHRKNNKHLNRKIHHSNKINKKGQKNKEKEPLKSKALVLVQQNRLKYYKNKKSQRHRVNSTMSNT